MTEAEVEEIEREYNVGSLSVRSVWFWRERSRRLLAEVKRLREGRDLAIARGLDLIDIDEKLKAENARLRDQLMDTAR